MKENFSLKIGTMRTAFELNEGKAPKNLREVRVLDKDEDLLYTEKYNQGKLSCVISNDGHEKWEFFYNSQGKLSEENVNGHTTLYFYNSDGTLQSMVNIFNRTKTDYYYINNKLVSERIYDSEKLLWQTDYRYDTNGKIIYTCQYGNDCYGKWGVLNEEWFLYNHSNRLFYKKTEDYEERREYDKNNRLVLIRIKDVFWKENLEKQIYYNEFGFVDRINVNGKVDSLFDYLFED